MVVDKIEFTKMVLCSPTPNNPIPSTVTIITAIGTVKSDFVVTSLLFKVI